jgi:septal ring factor EnvC (AmiA/AmiB activator)
VVALRASLQAVEAERAAEADARQREASLLERIAVIKRQLEEADSKMYAAQTGVEEFQHKKKAIDTQVDELRQQIRREAQVRFALFSVAALRSRRVSPAAPADPRSRFNRTPTAAPRRRLTRTPHLSAP